MPDGTILVPGASGGIGSAVARTLAGAGWRVGRREEAVLRTVMATTMPFVGRG